MLNQLGQMSRSQADFFFSELEKAKNDKPRLAQATNEEKARKAYQEQAMRHVRENYGDFID